MSYPREDRRVRCGQRDERPGMRRHGKFPAFEHLVPDRPSWLEGCRNDYRCVESQVLRTRRTGGIVADAHPDARFSETFVGGPVFKRVEQGLGHRFIGTGMANERQMRAMQTADLRFGMEYASSGCSAAVSWRCRACVRTQHAAPLCLDDPCDLRREAILSGAISSVRTRCPPKPQHSTAATSRPYLA